MMKIGILMTICVVAHAAKESDLVNTIPGFNETKLNFKVYVLR